MDRPGVVTTSATPTSSSYQGKAISEEKAGLAMMQEGW